MENELTEQLLEKAKQTKTPEELAALAKENGQEMSDESAKAYFNLLHPVNGELSDDELNDVRAAENAEQPIKTADRLSAHGIAVTGSGAAKYAAGTTQTAFTARSTVVEVAA